MQLDRRNVLRINRVYRDHDVLARTRHGGLVLQIGERRADVRGQSRVCLAGRAIACGNVKQSRVGQAIEKSLTSETGLQITVKLDNGEVLAIVQGSDESFAPGERVRVLRGHGSARVNHL